MKLDPRDYGMTTNASGAGADKKLPALKPDVLGNADAAVFTVADSRLGIMIRGKKRGLLVFEEQPGHSFWLTLQCIQTLIQKLGPDTDKWTGELVPIVKVRVENPETEEMVEKYNVAHPDDWSELIEENAATARAHEDAAADAPARKRGGK